MFPALPIQSVGHWWIPGNDSQSRGALRITKQGQATLEFDDFTEPGWMPGYITVDPVSAVAQVAAVHGSVEGRSVTLLDCQFRVSRLHQATVVTDALADSVIYGALADSADEEVFTSVGIELEHLTAWTAKALLHDATSDDTPWSPAVILEIPEPVTARTDHGVVTLEWSVKREGSPTTAGNVRHLLEATRFVVSADRLSARDARKEARRYQDLITLAAGKSAGLLSVRLVPLAGRQVGTASGVADYFFPTVVEADTRVQPLTWQQMAFSLNDVDFNDLMARWSEVENKFQGALAALLGFRYSPDQYIENQLVLLMAATEEAYRASGPNEWFIRPNEVKKVRKLIRAALRESPFAEHAEALAEKVDGRLTLDKRLSDLAEYVGAVDTVFGGSANLRTWIDAAKLSRNFLAHTGDDPNGRILKLRAIAFAAEAVVELAIFKGLGFGEAQVSEIARKRHMHVRWWIETEIGSN
jgi:hypothetical protein